MLLLIIIILTSVYIMKFVYLTCEFTYILVRITEHDEYYDDFNEPVVLIIFIYCLILIICWIFYCLEKKDKMYIID